MDKQKNKTSSQNQNPKAAELERLKFQIDQVTEQIETCQDDKSKKWGPLALSMLEEELKILTNNEYEQSDEKTTNRGRDKTKLGKDETKTIKSDLLLMDMKKHAKDLKMKSQAFEKKLNKQDVIDELHSHLNQQQEIIPKDSELSEMSLIWVWWTGTVGFFIGYLLIRLV